MRYYTHFDRELIQGINTDNLFDPIITTEQELIDMQKRMSESKDRIRENLTSGKKMQLIKKTLKKSK